MQNKKKAKSAKTRKLNSTTANTLNGVKAEPPAPASKTRKTPSEAKAILAKVEELRARGATIARALNELEIPYTNYHYWVKKYGEGGPKVKDAGANRTGLGAKAEKMQAVLNEISALRTNGTSLDGAVKQCGMTISNYYYWVRQLTTEGLRGGESGRPAGKGGTGSLIALLDAMTRNRKDRENLDAEFQRLLGQLRRKV